MTRRPRIVTALPLLAIPLLASCVAPRVVQAPVPRPAPPPAALPPPPTIAQDWTDGPVTPGIWSYRAEAGGTVAAYASAAGVPLFAMRCAGGGIAIVRPGAQAAVTIVTTGPARTLPADASGAARISPRDGFLDAMAFSRGRMLIQAPPMPSIVVPVQAEISRVIEDCRG